MSEAGGGDRVYGIGVDVSDGDEVAAFVSGAVERFGDDSSFIIGVVLPVDGGSTAGIASH